MKKKLATILFVLFQNTNKKSAKTFKKKEKRLVSVTSKIEFIHKHILDDSFGEKVKYNTFNA